MKLTLLFIAIICVPALAAGTVNDTLGKYGIQVDTAAGFKVIKDKELTGPLRKQHSIELRSPSDVRIEIKIITPLEAAAAQNLIEEEFTGLRKLYAAPETPYMGDIAQALGGCPPAMGPENKTVEFLKNKVQTVKGAVAKDMAFGACGEDQAKYWGAAIQFYDRKTKSLWSWRVLVPRGSKAVTLNSQWLEQVLAQFHNSNVLP